ncbi:MAG: Asp-tRNA(Asn)/Glu-tRNA(Gln) amidotransferase subunit GatC [Bacteroidia bacterium]|nr:Asp-tRNA(Asn)/Glu-tRNA(Gln) amidotransferase subunit GatC [Bacteroidia bacterium]
MEINDKMIDHLAWLSRLQFNGQEKEQVKKDLGRMLDFVNKLNELDTSGVEPLIYMSEEVNVLREDNIRKEIGTKEALMNAPKKDSDYFKVPKVVEKK